MPSEAFVDEVRGGRMKPPGRGSDGMTRYLISFPSGQVQEAEDACLFVFTGGLDDDGEPVVVTVDGTVTTGSYPET